MEISENSRVWIYQSDRPFTEAEEAQIKTVLDEFTSQWQAHGHQLAAKAEVRYNRFIILMVDEKEAGATGCSIDKSVQLIKQFEHDYKLDLFNRFNMAYKEGAEVKSCSRAQFEELIANGTVTGETIVFNNLVPTRKQLVTEWELPFSQSWHAKVFSLA